MKLSFHKDIVKYYSVVIETSVLKIVTQNLI